MVNQPLRALRTNNMAMTPKEIIAVVQHFDAGGEVQVKSVNPHITKWEDTDRPLWDFVNQVYRAKPKPLELWVNVYSTAATDVLHYSELDAKRALVEGGRTVHMREVVDEDS